MLAYFAEKVAEEPPTRNWDGLGACVDAEDEEAATEAARAVLHAEWCPASEEQGKLAPACAVALALRGAGTALLRAAYPDAIVQGVIRIKDRLFPHASINKREVV